MSFNKKRFEFMPMDWPSNGGDIDTPYKASAFNEGLTRITDSLYPRVNEIFQDESGNLYLYKIEDGIHKYVKFNSNAADRNAESSREIGKAMPFEKLSVIEGSSNFNGYINDFDDGTFAIISGDTKVEIYKKIYDDAHIEYVDTIDMSSNGSKIVDIAVGNDDEIKIIAVGTESNNIVIYEYSKNGWTERGTYTHASLNSGIKKLFRVESTDDGAVFKIYSKTAVLSFNLKSGTFTVLSSNKTLRYVSKSKAYDNYAITVDESVGGDCKVRPTAENDDYYADLSSNFISALEYNNNIERGLVLLNSRSIDESGNDIPRYGVAAFSIRVGNTLLLDFKNNVFYTPSSSYNTYCNVAIDLSYLIDRNPINYEGEKVLNAFLTIGLDAARERKYVAEFFVVTDQRKLKDDGTEYSPLIKVGKYEFEGSEEFVSLLKNGVFNYNKDGSFIVSVNNKLIWINCAEALYQSVVIAQSVAALRIKSKFVDTEASNASDSYAMRSASFKNKSILSTVETETVKSLSTRMESSITKTPIDERVFGGTGLLDDDASYINKYGSLGLNFRLTYAYNEKYFCHYDYKNHMVILYDVENDRKYDINLEGSAIFSDFNDLTSFATHIVNDIYVITYVLKSDKTTYHCLYTEPLSEILINKDLNNKLVAKVFTKEVSGLNISHNIRSPLEEEDGYGNNKYFTAFTANSVIDVYATTTYGIIIAIETIVENSVNDDYDALSDKGVVYTDDIYAQKVRNNYNYDVNIFYNTYYSLSNFAIEDHNRTESIMYWNNRYTTCGNFFFLTLIGSAVLNSERVYVRLLRPAIYGKSSLEPINAKFDKYSVCYECQMPTGMMQFDEGTKFIYAASENLLLMYNYADNSVYHIPFENTDYIGNTSQDGKDGFICSFAKTSDVTSKKMPFNFDSGLAPSPYGLVYSGKITQRSDMDSSLYGLAITDTDGERHVLAWLNNINETRSAIYGVFIGDWLLYTNYISDPASIELRRIRLNKGYVRKDIAMIDNLSAGKMSAAKANIDKACVNTLQLGDGAILKAEKGVKVVNKDIRPLQELALEMLNNEIRDSYKAGNIAVFSNREGTDLNSVIAALNEAIERELSSDYYSTILVNKSYDELKELYEDDDIRLNSYYRSLYSAKNNFIYLNKIYIDTNNIGSEQKEWFTFNVSNGPNSSSRSGLKFSLRGSSVENIKISIISGDNYHGKYSCSYSPGDGGPHSIQITSDGSDILEVLSPNLSVNTTNEYITFSIGYSSSDGKATTYGAIRSSALGTSFLHSNYSIGFKLYYGDGNIKLRSYNNGKEFTGTDGTIDTNQRIFAANLYAKATSEPKILTDVSEIGIFNVTRKTALAVIPFLWDYQGGASIDPKRLCYYRNPSIAVVYVPNTDHKTSVDTELLLKLSNSITIIPLSEQRYKVYNRAYIDANYSPIYTPDDYMVGNMDGVRSSDIHAYPRIIKSNISKYRSKERFRLSLGLVKFGSMPISTTKNGTTPYSTVNRRFSDGEMSYDRSGGEVPNASLMTVSIDINPFTLLNGSFATKEGWHCPAYVNSTFAPLYDLNLGDKYTVDNYAKACSIEYFGHTSNVVVSRLPMIIRNNSNFGNGYVYYTNPEIVTIKDNNTRTASVIRMANYNNDNPTTTIGGTTGAAFVQVLSTNGMVDRNPDITVSRHSTMAKSSHNIELTQLYRYYTMIGGGSTLSNLSPGGTLAESGGQGQGNSNIAAINIVSGANGFAACVSSEKNIHMLDTASFMKVSDSSNNPSSSSWDVYESNTDPKYWSYKEIEVEDKCLFILGIPLMSKFSGKTSGTEGYPEISTSAMSYIIVNDNAESDEITTIDMALLPGLFTNNFYFEYDASGYAISVDFKSSLELWLRKTIYTSTSDYSDEFISTAVDKIHDALSLIIKNSGRFLATLSLYNTSYLKANIPDAYHGNLFYAKYRNDAVLQWLNLSSAESDMLKIFTEDGKLKEFYNRSNTSAMEQEVFKNVVNIGKMTISYNNGTVGYNTKYNEENTILNKYNDSVSGSINTDYYALDEHTLVYANLNIEKLLNDNSGSSDYYYSNTTRFINDNDILCYSFLHCSEDGSWQEDVSSGYTITSNASITIR